MTEIPKDIMAAAMTALAVPEQEIVQSVARAILTEREQALAHLMANKLLDHMLDAILSGPQMRAMLDGLRDKS